MLTRSQNRLRQRFNPPGRFVESSDSEVSFNHEWLDRVLLGRASHVESEDATEADNEDSDMADDRQERRIQLLESAVMGMTEKFDELLTVFNPQSAHTAQPTPPAPRPPPRDVGHGGHVAESRPPVVDPRAPMYTDYVMEQLRREEFAVPRNDEGKGLASDMFIRELIPKPYMYLDRPGISTLTKKLDVRDTMTFHEYLICMIKMIRDPRADNQGLLDNHLEHLQQVIQDAAARDWPSVRRWSQSTFDAVEKGSASWDNRYAMQIDRLHHAIQASRPQYNSSSVAQIDRRDIPCKDFNAPPGCINNRSHQGRTVNFIHVCSVCFNAGERAPHPACLCPRRGHQFQQGSGPTRHQPPPHQPPTTTAPKNGSSASLQPRLVRPTLTEMMLQ